VVTTPDAALDRFRELLRIPTVSLDPDAPDADGTAFLHFHDAVARLYPHLHASLEREVVAEYSLLYRWRGRDAASPLVLMAHIDVVPVVPAEWTHDPFAAEVVGSGDAADRRAIEEAAAWLREGKTVAFPTETVYGLGADAASDEAVRRIFAAKGRPSDNPLIVHVAGIADAERLAMRISPLAARLMERFWPGPLTVVLPCRHDRVAPSVTAGLATVAVRVPAHPVALALLEAARIPVAAPSANLSGRPSPTTAAHVREDLDGRIDGILDGGPYGKTFVQLFTQTD